MLWQRLEERLEWKHGRTYVPKGSKKLMCHVDDLNLAHVSPDKYALPGMCTKLSFDWGVILGWQKWLTGF